MADPQLLKLASECVHPGAFVWDIGAAVGLFAFAASGLAGRRGRVLAVEPDPFLAGLIRRSALEQPARAATVDVVQAAACERSGLLSFAIAARGRYSNHILGAGQSQSGGVRATIPVEGVTLDQLLDRFPAPAVLKIDVEGCEQAVLRGAELLLASHRPVVLCEVAAVTAEEATALLHRAGYAVFDGSVPALERRELPMACWNTLALPRERT